MEKNRLSKEGRNWSAGDLARGGVLNCLGAFPEIRAQALKLHDIGEPDN
jgi:hypothetical protein